MRDTDYAYGVARVRANENSLLSPSDTEQLILATGYSDALRILADKGWQIPDSGTDFSAMLENESNKTWHLLTEAAPDIIVFNALIITNDFHNLKAALKSTFSNENPSLFFVEPSVMPAELIGEAVGTKNFDLLPEYMRASAEGAYDAIVRLASGRLADIIIDVAALNTKLHMAKESGNALLLDIAELACAASNIKTAVRSAKIGKDSEFMKRTMCECDILDSDGLIEAALAGESELIGYVSTTSLSAAAEHLKSGAVAFEKWCDDSIAEKVQSAKFTAFGPDPIIAYYINKDAEIKNARIILSAKLNNISPDMIRKRTRAVYV